MPAAAFEIDRDAARNQLHMVARHRREAIRRYFESDSSHMRRRIFDALNGYCRIEFVRTIEVVEPHHADGKIVSERADVANQHGEDFCGGF